MCTSVLSLYVFNQLGFFGTVSESTGTRRDLSLVCCFLRCTSVKIVTDGTSDDLRGWWLSPSFAQTTHAEDSATSARDAKTPAFNKTLPQEPWDTKWQSSRTPSGFATHHCGGVLSPQIRLRMYSTIWCDEACLRIWSLLDSIVCHNCLYITKENVYYASCAMNCCDEGSLRIWSLVDTIVCHNCLHTTEENVYYVSYAMNCCDEI
jgi:hypothetical protein